MTRISEVHGISTIRRTSIGSDEFADRGKQVAPVSYVPYLSLSVGEMRLQLAAQRAKILSQYYGKDAPEYAQAYNLLENALTAGVHGGAYFRGPIPDALQNTARLIRQAQYQTAPASGTFFGRTSLMNGIGAIIPAEQRKLECLKAAKGNPGKLAQCNHRFTIEQIMNTYLEPASPHMLYLKMFEYGVPQAVVTRAILHKNAVAGMANVGKISDTSLMAEWVETGILAANTKGGVGPVGSQTAAFYLAPDPEKYLKQFGINGPHIGFLDPTIAAALVSLLVSAIGLASKWLADLQKVDFRALAGVQGFGTGPFSASKENWQVGPQNELSTGIDTTTLLLLAVGGYLLATQE